MHQQAVANLCTQKMQSSTNVHLKCFFVCVFVWFFVHLMNASLIFTHFLLRRDARQLSREVSLGGQHFADSVCGAQQVAYSRYIRNSQADTRTGTKLMKLPEMLL